ncbi:hypothetical protein DFH07DRAFT_831582 [Mycena maculata]|uniref:Uncharacterized protein n=1 Tax=Mycena maculata TaxID=230809 RepID=A0AAD7IMY4_9AGAR|nr:hypothetical protein DFH07DRAFT_831582 [Mycena maculata]
MGRSRLLSALQAAISLLKSLYGLVIPIRQDVFSICANAASATIFFNQFVLPPAVRTHGPQFLKFSGDNDAAARESECLRRRPPSADLSSN